MDALNQLYEKLSARRDALIDLFGPRSELKRCNPDAYRQYQREVRELNCRLRSLRPQLTNNPKSASQRTSPRHEAGTPT